VPSAWGGTGFDANDWNPGDLRYNNAVAAANAAMALNTNNVFGGILWKRANRYGAISGVLSSYILYYTLNYMHSGTFEIVYKWRPEPFGWAMLIGFLMLIFGSLITKAEPKEKIDKFFDNMLRLSDEERMKHGQKPLASKMGHDLLLLDLPSWFTKEHVKDARKKMNFSNWNSYDDEKKLKYLEKIPKAIQSKMPMKSYLLIHKDAKLSDADKAAIKAWTTEAAFDLE